MTTPAQKKWYQDHKEAAKLATRQAQERNAEYWKGKDPYADPTLKICSDCRGPKVRLEFNRFCRAPDGLWSLCRDCDRIRRGKVGPTIPKMIAEAKKRAKSKNLKFDLVPEDLVMPEFCPVLGIKLEFQRSKAADNSPSIDKINPLGGYTRGNVRVISKRANLLKSNATLAELEKVLLDARNLQQVTKKELLHAV